MKGYYIVEPIIEDEDFDIKCSLHPERAKDEIPEEQQGLYVEMKKTNKMIRITVIGAILSALINLTFILGLIFGAFKIVQYFGII